MIRSSVLSEDGFTLLELLVVIAILGMLGVVGTLQLTSYLGNARSDTAKLQIEQLGTALDLFPRYADAAANLTAEAPTRLTLLPFREEPIRDDYT